jgi:hypothetical protein
MGQLDYGILACSINKQKLISQYIDGILTFDVVVAAKQYSRYGKKWIRV